MDRNRADKTAQRVRFIGSAPFCWLEMGLTKRCISYKKYKLYKLDKQPKNFRLPQGKEKIPQFLLIVLRGGKAKGERKRCEESKGGFLPGPEGKRSETGRSLPLRHRGPTGTTVPGWKNLYFLLGISVFGAPGKGGAGGGGAPHRCRRPGGCSPGRRSASGEVPRRCC